MNAILHPSTLFAVACVLVAPTPNMHAKSFPVASVQTIPSATRVMEWTICTPTYPGPRSSRKSELEKQFPSNNHPASCTFAGCAVDRSPNPCTAPWFLHRDGVLL